MDAGAKLNQRVWKLFESAGFTTKPNSSDPKEHQIKLSDAKVRTPDLLAEEKNLKVRIIGENKSGSQKGSLTALINDVSALMKKDKADAGLIVATKEEFKESDIAYAESLNVYVWDEDKLLYYEALVDTLKHYAKYEIIHSFGIKTKEQKSTHSVLALKFEQPFEDSKVSIFLFTITPEHLLKTCVIYRRAQGNKDAYQRMVKKKRLKGIKDFVSNAEALLPTNILVAFSDSINYDAIKTPTKDAQSKVINLSNEVYELVNLHIPSKYGSMEILDGQHRLYGFLETDDATKKIFNLVVVGISGLAGTAKRDTFIAINDNARRMDPNLVAFLKYTADEGECQKDNEVMAIKVAYDLSKDTHSPFKDKIRMLDVGDQIITLKGVVGYDMKGLLGKQGLLRKYHTNVSKEYVSILKDYFNTIKHHFKTACSDQANYIIFTNKGISAFLKLLKSILKHEGKKLTKTDITKYIVALKNNSKDSDWEIAKLKSKYVGSQGWKEFHRDLVKMVQKDIPGFKE